MLMNLVRWDPIRDIATMQDRMNRLFDGPLARIPVSEFGGWLPPVDISEEGDNLVLRAEIPGMSREDIDLKVENGAITLKGEKKQEQTVGAENAYRTERYFGAFSRTFVLPTTVDADAIKATYKDGILEVVLPKAPEARPRKIKVLTG